jgi:uncharacterized LabA/DUF88 family protein
MVHPSSLVVPTVPQYLFVDGGSLRGRLQNVSSKYFGEKNFDIDFQKLKGGFTKVFYYDAIPVRNEGESETDYHTRTAPIRAVFSAASSTDGVHVYEGDARRRQRRGLEQKMVDVMLAVDMLSHTFRRNMLSTTLLSGDADFTPLIDALVQYGMNVVLWYPADETSSELLRAADVRVKLGWYDLRSLLTESSQEAFVLPNPGHTSPKTQRGRPVFEWNVAGKEHGIYIRPDGQILVTREDDSLNTLHMSHANFDLLRECCREARDIVIPDAAAAALKSISPAPK